MDNLPMHTPGPWISTGFDYEQEAGWFVREVEDGVGQRKAVARVACSFREIKEIEATARLIAAAPDGLELAQEFLAFAKSGAGFNYPAGALQKLEQFIAKATKP